MTKAKNRMQIVYQYRPFTQHTINTLCRDELFFASPDTFNDPMDCKPSIVGEYDINALQMILRKLLEQRPVNGVVTNQRGLGNHQVSGRSKSKGLPDYMIYEMFSDIRERARNPEERADNYDEDSAEKSLLLNQITHELLKHYDKGVSCFSTKSDCPLMWSHYADRHAGFCVGYSLNRKPIPQLHQVIYDDNRTINVDLVYRALTLNDDDAKTHLEKLILAKKAAPWAYESEWRLFDEKGAKDSPLRMHDITFGLKCSYSVIHTVIRALETRAQPIKFYQITQCLDNYKLLKKPVEIGSLQSFYPNVARSCEEVFGPPQNVRINAPEIS
ncbi:DUF2971 domain-containing protein [Pseudidiomarina sp. 1APP75-27a]|uniref:DUF2971 domain-containing protein n=1 Tax=Pseudidiomarina terrestris TaxID=2820060 RepID=UPI002B05EA77|nr:DUF2971 domain-containing protein [Pseudidiomarina sp. 1APP75-27a]MEA3588418.1 DUF2971 domain-containing protein [Pseudidiomarina sp. 1APP75-27a]